MIVQGTDKIRGALTISKPRLEVSKNQCHRLSTQDFYSPEIQTALSMGYLKMIDDGKKVSAVDSSTYSGDGSKSIRCINQFERELTMNIFPHPIKPGEEFVVNDIQLNSADMKAAMSKGYIKIIGEQIGKQEQSAPMPEKTVNVTEQLLRAQSEGQSKSDQNSNLETNEEISTPSEVVETKSTNKAVVWGSKKNFLTDEKENVTKNQEDKRKSSGVVDNSHPDPVQADDVPNRASVVWNPTNNPVVNTMKKATVSDPSEEITFVDQKINQDRIDSHPTMQPESKEKAKDTIQNRNDDIKFADQSQERERINSHPVLNKGDSNANDPIDV